MDNGGEIHHVRRTPEALAPTPRRARRGAHGESRCAVVWASTAEGSVTRERSGSYLQSQLFGRLRPGSCDEKDFVCGSGDGSGIADDTGGCRPFVLLLIVCVHVRVHIVRHASL